MKEICEVAFVLFFAFLSCGLGAFIANDNWERKVSHGKQFISGNATYSCKKTNELKASD